MAKTFLTGIDLSQNQLIRARIENVATLPDVATAVAGQLVTLTSVTPNVVFYFDGTKWEPTRTTGPAGGDLEGSSYPNPVIADSKVTNSKIASGAVTTDKIADGTIVHGDVNAANIDGASTTPSLRTLGTGAAQAAAGDDPRLSDTRTPTDGVVRDVHVAVDAEIAREKIADPIAHTSNGGYRITNVADGVNDDDVATVAQVNAARAGLDAKDSVVAATTGPLAVTATATVLTASGNGRLTLDGISPAVGSRVLVKDQADPIENGIYDVTAIGGAGSAFVLTRSEDANDAGEISTGSQTLIEDGTANGRQVYAVNGTTADLWTPGAVGSTWVQIAGVSDVTAGSGLTRATGNVLNVVAGLGIVSNPDEVRIDTAVVPRLVTGTLPAGSTSATITHNLGRRHVLVQLFTESAPYEQVEADVLRTSVNAVTINTSEPVPAGIGFVVHG